MLPDLNYAQNVFIEISHLEHGGQGWELGTCLWSPVRDRGNSRAWQLMHEIKPGDFIIHLIDVQNAYHIYGFSTVSSNLIEVQTGPASPGKWENMSPYQRINLTNYSKLNTPQNINSFFNQYEGQLRQVLDNHEFGQFYTKYNADNSLRMSQRYIARCPPDLYNIFNEFTNQIGFNPVPGSQENVPTLNEPQNPDYNPPSRFTTKVSRVVRDTNLSRRIKVNQNWSCQICGKVIALPSGHKYAEAHHLQPLGGNDPGPDVQKNIMVLCPTHHAEFDYGSIAINVETRLIEHIDTDNEFHGKKVRYEREDLGEQFLTYHYVNRFNKT